MSNEIYLWKGGLVLSEFTADDGYCLGCDVGQQALISAEEVINYLWRSNKW